MLDRVTSGNKSQGDLKEGNILKMNVWDKFLLNISIYFGTIDE